MNNQTRVIFITVLGLIAVIGLFLALVKPTLAKIDELNTNAINKKTELKQLEEQIISYKNSQRDLSKASGKEIIFDSLLVREDLQYAIIEIENGAKAAQVIETMEIEEEPKGKNADPKELVSGKTFLEEVKYSVNTTSDFAQLITFMKYLEHMSHFTEVSKIFLQSSVGIVDTSGTQVRDGMVVGNIELVFFVQKK